MIFVPVQKSRERPALRSVPEREFEEKEIVLDSKSTKFQAMTFNGSIPGPLMVVHAGDYVELMPETDMPGDHLPAWRTVVNENTGASGLEAQRRQFTGIDQGQLAAKPGSCRVEVDVVRHRVGLGEWTSTCFRRVALDAGAQMPTVRTENCGVRVVEGEYRTYVTDSVRDARAAGCAVGMPPAKLGFRLVRDRPERREPLK